MVDTPRSLAVLQAIYAENMVGDISAQDGRDMLASTASSINSRFVASPWSGMDAPTWRRPQEGTARHPGAGPGLRVRGPSRAEWNYAPRFGSATTSAPSLSPFIRRAMVAEILFAAAAAAGSGMCVYRPVIVLDR